MSTDIAHFAFGATMTSLVVSVFLPTIRYPRTIVVLGGGWALFPDVHWVSPVARAQLYELHGSVLAELFWFHRTLDRLDPNNSRPFAAGVLAVFVVTTLLLEWRSDRAPRPLGERHSDPKGGE